MRGPLGVLLAGLALALAAGCGIGDSVANECIGLKRVYERAQKRNVSLATAGVPADAAVSRAAAERLARARADYTACVAAPTGEPI